MLVKDVIALACDFTDNSALGDKIRLSQDLTDDEQAQMDIYLKCFNLVNNEIASEFVPIKKIEQFDVESGKVLFSKFSNKPYKILYVKNSLGKKMRFKVFQDHIVVFCKKAIIAYTILPENLTATDMVETFIPERIYAYGLAREYLFFKAMFDDAEIFEERFKNSLEIICRASVHSKMPRRRWI